MMNAQGLYHPSMEHDACGVGFVVKIDGTRTHQIVRDGVQILKNLVHRGAVGGDLKTGDGAGMILQIPHRFFSKVLKFPLPAEGKYGVGMLFLPQQAKDCERAKKMIAVRTAKEGGKIIGWREVPIHPDCLGEMAREVMPSIWQVFVAYDGLEGLALERRLYILRKVLENEAVKLGWALEDFYIPSLSSRTIVYKGMFAAPQFDHFFIDLTDTNLVSALAVVHQRYSTNTFPSWALAHPFHFVAHNGEINTLRGNINKMMAREARISSELLGSEIKKLLPIINPSLSDSGIFDNVFELLTLGGRSMEHAMMMMVPEAFGVKYHISEAKRAFFEYHAAIMEPWDGPAAIAFTDGMKVGAILDRNGLRPARYVITKSGLVIMASEVGVLDINPPDVLEKGMLAPGKMLLVDTAAKRVIKDNEIKSGIARRKPYRQWLEENRIELRGLLQVPGPVEVDEKTLALRQRIFGYTLEDEKMILLPMAENAQEPVGSMGNDAALAVLSNRPQLLYNYFRQLFAQVTNPPIDPYRENLVMSLMSFVGRQGNLLDETPQHCHQLKLSHPVLTNDDIERLKTSNLASFRVATVPMLFDPSGVPERLENAIQSLCEAVEQKFDQGCSLVILSDRGAGPGQAPIPALLAVTAVHQYLIRKSKRYLGGLVLETGEAREVHHFACLVGYGVNAINPYLVFETLVDLKKRGHISEGLTLEAAIENYITAIKKGLLKVMSKMGISTIRSYRGAQIFEAVGLSDDFVERYFPGTSSRIRGIGLDVVMHESLERFNAAFQKAPANTETLDSGGNYHYRLNAEKHLFSPLAIVNLQKSVREGDYSVFKRYTSEVNDISKNLCTLRGLFKFKKGQPVPIEEVESEDSIVRRFVSSAMSFGSISKEAHETIAIAMNRLGAASNSGEGGEDESRYKPLPNGDSRKSMIKQVASARFGVTIDYLANSRELQIKMAQGAKPGEGGQLPGHKVDEMIAKVRHATPGVMLISPPPHHDIYSIEDLAQLIFDLKNANPEARVSVKLVSEVGVGTVAAGVAKGKADMVLISGHDGGTGASPISSIKYAGSPWEIGLAEAQQVLVMNKLRDRIRVQVDGQIKTGRDVVIGAMLGAEEFGFGTTSLVTLGCIMMRKCHLNTCPVGVATQNPELRKRFSGRPEYLMNFMKFIAREVRELMAELGFRKFEDMVGRVDRLEVFDAVTHYKTRGLDFSKVLATNEAPPGGSIRYVSASKPDFSLSLDPNLIEKARAAIEFKQPVVLSQKIRNCNRTVGTTLSYEIAKRYGLKGLPEDTIRVKFEGSAGQSFGAFLARGVTFELEGDANDYFGKGLSGGRIIVYPPSSATFRPQDNIITGNVNLFGATGGEVYIHGRAGERFCVRNSGALAVVEGVGDHGCEYMTGGRVIILGQTGVNFAAGMSGGIAYVLDESQLFDTRCNLEMVDLEPVAENEEREFLKKAIERHAKFTGSKYAKSILASWEEMLPRFVKVMPMDYKKALAKLKERQSERSDVAEMTEEVFF
ncbi:MAG: glutamate synthase large subunit [Candidatus Omnitrophota bacterium]|jgi:glutamate synthase domain-containing protein 2/glutamate synthase domain-containing protein 1/glutamate synthase domain-containing protein 3